MVVMEPEQHRPAVFVHLLPSLLSGGPLSGGVAVVVDVLRATTVMVQALASGSEAVIPCLEIEEARTVAKALPVGSAILAGERQGLPIEGFDFGNSPDAFTREVCAGKTVVMTTTNGTRAILDSLKADKVYVAAFSNLTATIEALSRLEQPIHIVASGTDGLISFEDSALAGAIASGLGRPFGNDEALLAAGLWGACRSSLESGRSLYDLLSMGRGGKRVRSIGLADDVKAAAAIDRNPIVATLTREPLRIVREQDLDREESPITADA